ncbi:MAG: LemA family protein [Candidatus Krumholzibacteriia bacterium]
MVPWGWFLLVVLVVLAYAIVTYNRFIGLRQRLANAFSDIDVQLKRRWDLVPALVETVRGYAGHEHQVLAAVVAARGAAMGAPSGPVGLPERSEKEAGLASSLRGIFALVEDYPALKADANFLELHRELVTIEDDLQHARRYHNAVVRDLNTLRQSFPAGLVGRAAGIAAGVFFQLDDAQRAVPAVDLGPVRPAKEP